jgi:hypothetical protein
VDHSLVMLPCVSAHRVGSSEVGGEKWVDMVDVEGAARSSLLLVTVQHVVVQMAELKMQQRALQQLMVECRMSLDVGGEHLSAASIAGVINVLSRGHLVAGYSGCDLGQKYSLCNK